MLSHLIIFGNHEDFCMLLKMYLALNLLLVVHLAQDKIYIYKWFDYVLNITSAQKSPFPNTIDEQLPKKCK